MKFAGEILADLAGGSTSRGGGVFGIGAREVTREQFTPNEALERIARALEKLDIGAAINLWVGDRRIFETPNGSPEPLAAILDDANVEVYIEQASARPDELGLPAPDVAQSAAMYGDYV